MRKRVLIVLGAFMCVTLNAQDSIVETLQADLEKKAEEIKALKEVNAKLTREIGEIAIQADGRHPKTVNYVSREIKTDKAYFRLWTKKPGSFRVSLFRSDTGSLLESVKLEHKINDFPYVTGKKLTPGVKYYVKVEILNNKDIPIKGRVLDKDNHPKMEFTTLEFTDPIKEVDFKVTPTHNSLMVEVNRTKPYLVKMELWDHDANNLTAKRNIVVQGNNIEINEFGQFSSSLSAGKREYEFTKLKSGTKYTIQVTVVDKFGRKAVNQKWKSTETDEFEFDGPIVFDFGTLKNTIKWKVTGDPKSAKVLLKDPTGNSALTISDEVTPNADGKSFTANLDNLKNLVEIWKVKQSEEKSKGVTQHPIIEISMVDVRNKVKKMSAKIAFVLPTMEEIQDAKEKNLIGPDEVKKLTRAVERLSKREGGKINWGEIAATGLPILLSIL